MRKAYILLLLLITPALLLVGCSKTANAIVDYNNDFLTEDYTKTLDTFISLSMEYEDWTEDDLEKQTLFLEEQLIPQAKQLVKLVNNLTVEDETVKELHQLLVVAEENRLLAIEKEHEYLQDIEQEEVIDEAIEYILESERKMDEFIERLESLKDEHNIEEDI